MIECALCPRACKKKRTELSGEGFCGAGRSPKIARAALHEWEEPCISGTRGSGAVFFCGCALRCMFCQNAPISAGGVGETVSVERLREIYFELAAAGAHNINLVNPTHFTEAVLLSLAEPLPVPVVYNSGGYDSVAALQSLEGKISVYLPDLKYYSPALARRYSAAEDYPQTARAAILEMFRQTGPFLLDESGMMSSGLIIRHLMLPGQTEDTLDVIDWVLDTFPAGSVMLSLMSQYTPCGDLSRYPEINRTLSEKEYRRVEDYILCLPSVEGYLQERDSAGEGCIPDFNLFGVHKPK